MQDGSVQLSEPDQRAPSYSSWCKIYAIFGDDFTQSKIDSGQRLPGGQKKYVNPSVEQLKRKLALYTRVTRVCGTTQTVTATVPAAASTARCASRKRTSPLGGRPCAFQPLRRTPPAAGAAAEGGGQSAPAFEPPATPARQGSAPSMRP